MLISAIRKYFPESATEEILKEFRPFICPLDTACFNGQMLLCLFLPTTKSVDLIEECLEIWNWMTNSPQFLAWDSGFFSLFSRLAKDNIGIIDWDPYLGTLFSHILRNFDLPVGSSVKTHSSTAAMQFDFDSDLLGLIHQAKDKILENSASMIIHMMGQKNQVMVYLKKLISSIET